MALVPAIAFTATGLLGRDDVNGVEWNILILIMGGIALGAGMQRTGLDQILVNAIPVGGLILAAMVLATLVFSTFMSNTAASNLLLPIGVSFAVAGGGQTIQLGISIALAASVAMALPISTPPNAIAYARGEVNTRDMALAGSLIGVLATVLIVAFGGPIISFWLNR